MMLALLFALALVPRLYSAQSLGWHWDYPGSFTLINFDEGGSCRAALDGFSYSTFLGRQTIALASSIGVGPPEGVTGDRRLVKAYCHSPAHITVARVYSALLGALTVVAVAVLALQLVPGQPAVAWTAATLVALSGFHISESHSATVDAPLVFFIYSFLAVLAWSRRHNSAAGLILSLPLAVAAVWTKYWVFALFAYLSLVPAAGWSYVIRGFSAARLTAVILVVSVFLAALTNLEFPAWGLVPVVALYCLLVPWRAIKRPMIIVWFLLPAAAWLVLQVELINHYTAGTEGGGFGSGYGAIGNNKWLRNLVNVPAVLLVGLGLPACLFIPLGVRRLWRREVDLRVWSSLLPLLAFLLFMAFLAPVTYYRHYLALVPIAAILAAMGLCASGWARRPWFLLLFFIWPALLAADLVADYHRDPRQQLRQWYSENPDVQVLASYYVSPPPGTRSRLFLPSEMGEDTAVLKGADFLVLSENWYDTAFASELNGPRVGRLDRLVKTTPQYASFYRDALAGRHPVLREEVVYSVRNFMPELWLHKKFYGSFPMFVGDLRIYSILD
jgi:dolichyl-phosphate-mannose-protein mannosyltransferase